MSVELDELEGRIDGLGVEFEGGYAFKMSDAWVRTCAGACTSCGGCIISSSTCMGTWLPPKVSPLFPDRPRSNSQLENVSKKPKMSLASVALNNSALGGTGGTGGTIVGTSDPP